jgi:hypothetical protein
VLTIGPDGWKRPGFWEDFFDYKPEAVALFEEEYQAILRSGKQMTVYRLFRAWEGVRMRSDATGRV